VFRGGAAVDATWFVAKAAGFGWVGVACASRASLLILALRSYVTVSLAFVASERLSDILVCSYNVVMDLDAVGKQGVGRLRGRTYDLEVGNSLIARSPSWVLDPCCRGDSVAVQVVFFFDLAEVFVIAWVKVGFAWYKAQYDTVRLVFYQRRGR
jgi:hypothetical protein